MSEKKIYVLTFLLIFGACVSMALALAFGF